MKNLFISAALMLFVTAPALAYDYDTELAAQNTPDGWTAVSLPVVPDITDDNTFDITDYDASTSSEDNAEAIQAALDACYAAGGGMVVIPAGEWLSGALVIKGKTILHLAAGATLKMTPYGVYPSDVATDFISNPNTSSNVQSDIVIEGEDKETSIIDGQGADWWAAYEEDSSIKRGAMIRFNRGSRHLVCNLTLKNAPGANLTLGRSGNASHMTAHDLIITAPASELSTGASHNTDGIPVWGPYVNIYNCEISNGDDNVVFDSNSQYGHVWDCYFGTGHGASIGSYTANMHDILWEDITMEGTTSGIRMKTNTGRSGEVYNITYRNITMTNILENPISITSWYDDPPTVPLTDSELTDSTSNTPYWHDILIQNVTSTGTTYSSNSDKRGNAIYLLGRPESRIKDVTFDNVQVSAARGMYMSYAHDIVFTNCCKITNTKTASQYFAPDITNFENQVDLTYTGTYDGSDCEDVSEDDDDTTDDSAESVTATISASTATCESGDYTWTFNNGYTVTSAKGDRGYATAKDYLKYSRNYQFIINLPEDVSITEITFDGYCNTSGGTSYLYELNGVEYDEDTYVFPAVDADPSTASYTITLSSAASGTLTFTPKGDGQSCFIITLVGTTATGIQQVYTIKASDDDIVYDLQGRRMTSGNLRPGIYIKGGKKMVVK